MLFSRHFIPLTLLGVAALIIAIIFYITYRNNDASPHKANVATADAIPAHTSAESSALHPGFESNITNITGVIDAKNRHILTQRKQLERIANEYLLELDISEEDFNWLKNLAEEYRMEPRHRTDRNYFNDLRVRVDSVPPALVLAHVALSNQQPPLEYISQLMQFNIPCETAICIEQAHTNLLAKSAIDWMYSLNTHPDFNPLRRTRAQFRDQEPAHILKELIAQLPAIKDDVWNYSAVINSTISTLNLVEHP